MCRVRIALRTPALDPSNKPAYRRASFGGVPPWARLNIGGALSSRRVAAGKVTRWPKGRARWVERFGLCEQGCLRGGHFSSLSSGSDPGRGLRARQSSLPNIARHPCSPASAGWSARAGASAFRKVAAPLQQEGQWLSARNGAPRPRKCACRQTR